MGLVSVVVMEVEVVMEVVGAAVEEERATNIS